MSVVFMHLPKAELTGTHQSVVLARQRALGANLKVVEVQSELSKLGESVRVLRG